MIYLSICVFFYFLDKDRVFLCLLVFLLRNDFVARRLLLLLLDLDFDVPPFFSFPSFPFFSFPNNNLSGWISAVLLHLGARSVPRSGTPSVGGVGGLANLTLERGVDGDRRGFAAFSRLASAFSRLASARSSCSFNRILSASLGL